MKMENSNHSFFSAFTGFIRATLLLLNTTTTVTMSRMTPAPRMKYIGERPIRMANSSSHLSETK